DVGGGGRGWSGITVAGVGGALDQGFQFGMGVDEFAGDAGVAGDHGFVDGLVRVVDQAGESGADGVVLVFAALTVVVGKSGQCCVVGHGWAGPFGWARRSMRRGVVARWRVSAMAFRAAVRARRSVSGSRVR